MIDTGGPAYPESCNGQIIPGKTLLDDFAGLAMQVLLTDEYEGAIADESQDRNISYEAIRAEWSYDLAVAMVKEKRKREE